MADSNLKSEGPLIQTLRLKGGPVRPGLENDIFGLADFILAQK